LSRQFFSFSKLGSPFFIFVLAVCKTQKSRTAQGFFVKYTTDFSPLLWYNLVGKKTKNHKSRRKNHAK